MRTMTPFGFRMRDHPKRGNVGVTVNEIESLESLPIGTQAVELQPGATYLILVTRGSVNQAVLERIPAVFEKMGMKAIVLTALDTEKDVKLYTLKREADA